MLTRGATSRLAVAVATTEAQHGVGNQLGVKHIAAGPKLRLQLQHALGTHLVYLLSGANHSLQLLPLLGDNNLVVAGARARAIRPLRAAGAGLPLGGVGL